MTNSMLVAGLGNPGPKYETTRHNLGFMVVDELHVRAHGQGWQDKFKGLFSRVQMHDTSAILLKPQTFMNLSGRSVARAAAFHQIEKNQIVVVHDDLDLDFGVIRVKVGGGTGGHKGIESCRQELGSADFLRIRIGIGRPVHGDVTNFVLQSFTSEEQISLHETIRTAADAVESVIGSGIVKTMNYFNKRQGETK